MSSASSVPSSSFVVPADYDEKLSKYSQIAFSLAADQARLSDLTSVEAEIKNHERFWDLEDKETELMLNYRWEVTAAFLSTLDDGLGGVVSIKQFNDWKDLIRDLHVSKPDSRYESYFIRHKFNDARVVMTFTTLPQVVEGAKPKLVAGVRCLSRSKGASKGARLEFEDVYKQAKVALADVPEAYRVFQLILKAFVKGLPLDADGELNDEDKFTHAHYRLLNAIFNRRDTLELPVDIIPLADRYRAGRTEKWNVAGRIHRQENELKELKAAIIASDEFKLQVMPSAKTMKTQEDAIVAQNYVAQVFLAYQATEPKVDDALLDIDIKALQDEVASNVSSIVVATAEGEEDSDDDDSDEDYTVHALRIKFVYAGKACDVTATKSDYGDDSFVTALPHSFARKDGYDWYKSAKFSALSPPLRLVSLLLHLWDQGVLPTQKPNKEINVEEEFQAELDRVC
jgi:hypothetical protein